MSICKDLLGHLGLNPYLTTHASNLHKLDIIKVNYDNGWNFQLNNNVKKINIVRLEICIVYINGIYKILHSFKIILHIIYMH